MSAELHSKNLIEQMDSNTMAANASPIQKIIGNLFSLSFGEIVARGLSFLAVSYLARTLGAEGFGLLSFAIVFLSFFVLFTQSGLDTYGVREISKDRDNFKLYAQNIVAVKLIISILAYACLAAIVSFNPQLGEMRGILLIYGLSLFTLSFTLNWVFLGLEKMHVTAVGGVITQLIYVSGVFLFIHGTAQIMQVPAIQVGAEAVVLIFYLVVFFKAFGSMRLQFDLSLWKKMLIVSIPLSLSAIMMGINYNFDLLMLGFLQGAEVVGWYSAAYKVVLLILGMVTLFHLGIFPTIAQYFERSKREFEELIKNTLKATVMLALPIGIIGTLFAPLIIGLIYGSGYENAIVPLQILIWAIVVIIIRTNYKLVLVVADKQKQYLQLIFIASLVNIGLNLLLIPRISLIGAAIATLISETVFLFLIHLYTGRTVINIPAGFLLRLLIPGIIMGMAAILLVLTTTNPFIALAGSLACFLLSLLLFRAITFQQVEWIYASVKESLGWKTKIHE